MKSIKNVYKNLLDVENIKKIIFLASKGKRKRREVKKVRKAKHICVSQARSLMSLIGWLKQTNLGYLYYKNHIKKYVKLGFLKRIISNYDKKVKFS